jgi:hypothetical protein
MQEYAGVMGCPSDKATIEHLNWDGPFSWWAGLKEEDLVICCGSCNSSRGQTSLPTWFASSYCVQRGITASTVAEEVKHYLDGQPPGTVNLRSVESNPDWARIAKEWEDGGDVLGVLIWRQWPWGDLWVVGTFIGVNLIFNSFAYVALGLNARRLPV